MSPLTLPSHAGAAPSREASADRSNQEQGEQARSFLNRGIAPPTSRPWSADAASLRLGITGLSPFISTTHAIAARVNGTSTPTPFTRTVARNYLAAMRHHLHQRGRHIRHAEIDHALGRIVAARHSASAPTPARRQHPPGPISSQTRPRRTPSGWQGPARDVEEKRLARSCDPPQTAGRAGRNRLLRSNSADISEMRSLTEYLDKEADDIR